MLKEMPLEKCVDDLSVNFGKQGRTKSSKIVREMLFRTVDKVLQNAIQLLDIEVFLRCADSFKILPQRRAKDSGDEQTWKTRKTSQSVHHKVRKDLVSFRNYLFCKAHVQKNIF